MKYRHSKWLLAGALLLAPSLAMAQNQGQIVPSGHFTTGHTIRCQNSTCTVAVDGGGAAGSGINGQGYLTELGITNTGTPLCINDALTNAVGGYHQLCLGPNALGGGLISYNAYGGAPPLGLNFNINGTTYAFPPAGVGTGNVVGPNTSAATHIATWNNPTGTLLADPAFVSAVFTNTQMNEYAASLLNGISPSTQYSGSFAGNFATDALTGGVTVPNTSTVYQANGVSCYATNASATTNTVACFGLMTGKGAGTHIWGSNFVVQDGGFAAATEVGLELDINNSSASTVVANGLSILGASTASPLNGNAISVGAMGPGIKWPTAGLFVGDASAVNAIVVGKTAASGANIGSQAVLFDYTTGASAAVAYVLSVDTAQRLKVATSAGSGLSNFVVDGTLAVDTGHSTFGILAFADAGTTKYEIFRDATTDNLVMSDLTNSLTFLSVVASSGTMTLGETGKIVNLVGTTLQSNGTAGVTCAPGSPTSSFSTANGIVTHC